MNEWMEKYANPFAAWETRLYLNSHPHDRQAIAEYRRYLAASAPGNYADIGAEWPQESAAGTRIDGGDACCFRWPWVDDPWPWDADFVVQGGEA